MVVLILLKLLSSYSRNIFFFEVYLVIILQGKIRSILIKTSLQDNELLKLNNCTK